MELDKRINGTTILTGLIGNPVGHTVSPFLHNSLFTALGINGIYVPLQVPSGGLKDAVMGLKATGFSGFNVTIPYKEEVCEFLDVISADARLLGAVNTVKISDGKLYGFNTDADGFIRAFEDRTGTNFKQKKVSILGAGGTARTLAIRIALEGAERIDIINRTITRAMELAEAINKIAVNPECTNKRVFAFASGTQEAIQALKDCDIMINTTSVGMHPEINHCPISQDFVFGSNQIIYDVIYNPAQTKLLTNANAFGCKIFNGSSMLLYQGVQAFEIFLDRKVPPQIVSDLTESFLIDARPFI